MQFFTKHLYNSDNQPTLELNYELIGSILISFLLILCLTMVPNTNASEGNDTLKPYILDPDLEVQLVTKDLEFPTTMAFLGPDDLLVLEKNKGTLERVTNGIKKSEPLLDVNVSYLQERGMLGIAVVNNQSDNSDPLVFLYYTKSLTQEDEKSSNNFTNNVSNHLYRYELINDSKLQNPKLLLKTPPTWRSFHVGGDLLIGPDGNLYATIGDQTKYKATLSQNIKNGTLPDITSSILRMTYDGEAPSDNILGNTYPLNLYYAYGIRNSFGIDFDPITGKLWDTETGPDYGDEINLVEPGFNSGWSKVQGHWRTSEKLLATKHDLSIGNEDLNPNDLVYFDGKGNYSLPEFVWKDVACVIAIKFLDSDKYGDEYENDPFVGTSGGNLYHFKMNAERNGFVLKGNLKDTIADNDSDEEMSQLRFGGGFGAISDIQVSPYDGLLYLVSVDGKIYKIIPKDYQKPDVFKETNGT